MDAAVESDDGRRALVGGQVDGAGAQFGPEPQGAGRFAALLTALTVARLTARRVASSARVRGPVLYNNFSTRERFARPTSEEFSSQSSGAEPSRPVDSSAIMDPAYPQPPEFVALSNKLA